MSNEQFYNLCMKVFELVRKSTPIRTGNLRYNAVRLEFVDGGNECRIYVDGDGEEGIAYYMPFTNEKWISPKWNGKKNPNEGWWQKTADKIAEMIKDELGDNLAEFNKENKER